MRITDPHQAYVDRRQFDSCKDCADPKAAKVKREQEEGQ